MPIYSLSTENDWLVHLQDLPAWEPPRIKTVVLSPHPDDETLGAGGMIASLRRAGVEVAVIAVTDGENAYADTRGLGPIRVREQQQALRQLGVGAGNLHRLRLTDSDVTAAETQLLQEVMAVVDEKTHLVAPWTGDFHPDHEAVGRVAVEAARQCGARLTQYFFWTWHQGTPAMLRHCPLRRFPLDARMQDAKRRALACHRSQLTHPSGQPILPEELLTPAHWPFEVYLPI